MTKYGREYLTPIEYEQRLATMLWRYYRFLGMAVLQRRDREFWELHRAWMDRIGLPISNITLAKGLLGVLLGGLLDIRNTYNEIARYYRRR